MSFLSKNLFNLQLTGAAATAYTSTNVRTRLDQVTVANTSLVTPYTATVYLIPSGSAAGAAFLILNARPILPGETFVIYPLIGQVLNPGDFIQGLASTTLVLNFVGSGMLMSP